MPLLTAVSYGVVYGQIGIPPQSPITRNRSSSPRTKVRLRRKITSWIRVPAMITSNWLFSVSSREVEAKTITWGWNWHRKLKDHVMYHTRKRDYTHKHSRKLNDQIEGIEGIEDIEGVPGRAHSCICFQTLLTGNFIQSSRLRSFARVFTAETRGSRRFRTQLGWYLGDSKLIRVQKPPQSKQSTRTRKLCSLRRRRDLAKCCQLRRLHLHFFHKLVFISNYFRLWTKKNSKCGDCHEKKRKVPNQISLQCRCCVTVTSSLESQIPKTDKLRVATEATPCRKRYHRKEKFRWPSIGLVHVYSPNKWMRYKALRDDAWNSSPLLFFTFCSYVAASEQLYLFIFLNFFSFNFLFHSQLLLLEVFYVNLNRIPKSAFHYFTPM